MTKDEYAIILDYLPNGYPMDRNPGLKTSIAQAISTSNLMLLELVPKKDIFLNPLEKVYIGEGQRDKIHHINKRLPYEKVTQTAKSIIQSIVSDLIDQNEEKFVSFFNSARPLTTRMHQIELLPGLGKKHMWEIIDEREVEPFKNFEDIKKRVKLLPDPKKIIMKRILKEIQGNEKHYVFVEAPHQETPDPRDQRRRF